jgi:hypothetical protein
VSLPCLPDPDYCGWSLHAVDTANLFDGHPLPFVIAFHVISEAIHTRGDNGSCKFINTL